ncbi:hypothetical protein JDV02_007772 [Purpureocillium takamizusanense]|uniref:Uncharacterized protein n=1 Tax=Purpureocillium takamizusanense TaxID=2060973 RepID=A0A9Q8VE16_9HYPO|nr:uncharacterized protein JDV02_007772 [Purpureocillium takamizusanense]UNI21816.1 hypothetical protein JDV02_007772 [Purpureocillium takamizusanense]
MKLATRSFFFLGVVFGLAGEVLALPHPPSEASNVTTIDTALLPETDNVQLARRSGFTKMECAVYKSSTSAAYHDSTFENKDYFRHTHKGLLTLGPGECDRVGCWEDVGVWWCNEDTKNKKRVSSWLDVEDAIFKMHLFMYTPGCETEPYLKWSNRIYHTDGWSVTVSRKKGQEC